ncbi:cytochrome P450 [Thalassobius sp. S69A]|uniref:cytochrome P450 n=1 Tax=unclassified Thalassovita TaxID=2619711 RepID=UPI000C0DF2D0|nr:hypothetical protein [Paracoccaceae bacterium]MBT26442.1 hypothetical protein [Paracoccaceae bacterium]
MKKWRSWFSGSARNNAPQLPVDLADAAMWADPAPVWAWLRENQPLAQVASGGYVLTRHADIVQAFGNPALGNQPSRFSVLAARNRGKSTAAAVAAHIPPFLDKPEHVPARQAVSGAFHAAFKGAETWVPELAEARVAALAGQRFDLIEHLAQPFACAVMARFIGLPEDRVMIKQATQGFFHLFAPITDRARFGQVNTALESARAALSAAAEQPPSGSFLAHLRGAGVTENALLDNALLVLADGVENIEAGIATALDLTLRHADRIAPDSPVQALVSESLRLASPAQVIARVTRTPMTLHGVDLAEGAPVFLALGAANLDPMAHPDPLRFDPNRTGEEPLLFGRGRHRCIGAQLGLLQISAMLKALRAAGAMRVDQGPVHCHARFGHRWPVAMRVSLA